MHAMFLAIAAAADPVGATEVASVAGAGVAADRPQTATGPRPNRDADGIPAQQAVTKAVALGGMMSIVSDYRMRGVSQSRGNATVQGSFELSSRNGAYAGTWASSISPSAGGGAHAQVDVYGGYRRTFGGLDLDVGLTSTFYPGADHASSAEFYGSIGSDLNGTKLKTGVGCTPQQDELGTHDGLYLFVDAERDLPGTPVVMRAHIGRETGVNTVAGAQKIDVMLAAEVAVGPATLSAAYVDSRMHKAPPAARGGGVLVLAATMGF